MRLVHRIYRVTIAPRRQWGRTEVLSACGKWWEVEGDAYFRFASTEWSRITCRSCLKARGRAK